MGLLDFMQTPQGMGLLSAVAGGMAGARRGTPWNNVGRGLTSGVVGYNAALEDQRLAANTAIADKYRSMQMQQIEQEIERARTLKEAGQAAAGKAMIPGSHGPLGYKPTDPSAFVGQLAQGNAPEDQEFNLANMEAIAEGNNALAPEPEAKFDPASYRNVYMQELASRGMPDEAMKYAPEPTKPMVLGKTLVDPATGKVIAVDETWKEETAANREQRIQELQMRLEDQRLSREQNMALRRELADQQAALRRDLAAQSSAQAGRPPSGYRYTPTGELEAIPGGPADIKAGELGDKRAKQRDMQIAQAGNVLGTVREAKGLVGYSTTGVGGLASGLPMTRARDLAAKLTTIKANLGFDRLQQMRDSSPTGGALGQVAVQELTALQATIANLDQQQSPAQLKASLDKIETHYNKWLETVKSSDGNKKPAASDPLGIRR